MNGHSNENWTFDTDPAKQAQEVFFSCKVQMISHRPLFFNQNMIMQISLQNI